MDSFWKLIDSIRQKPPEVRSHAAFLAAACLTFLIGLLWVSTLPAQFSRISDSASNAAAGDAITEFKEKVSEGVESSSEAPAQNSELNFEPANFATETVREQPAATTTTTGTTSENGARPQPILIETVPSSETVN